MLRAKVLSQYWASRRIGSLPSGAYLEVELTSGSTLIAFDPLGCAEGEWVMVTQGSVAAGYFLPANAPVDALIVGSLDEKEHGL